MSSIPAYTASWIKRRGYKDVWSNVIGETRVKRILENALELQKLPGAYLFAGPEGTGKDAMAFELAKAVNCLDTKLKNLEACDECASCLQIANFTSPAVTFVHALAKDVESTTSGESNQKDDDLEATREQLAVKAVDLYHNLDIPRATSIQVGQIRNLRMSLTRSLSGGKKRVVIISEADMMNSQAQNAFLKTLEEPHANTLLILTSSNPNRFYPTILSRCQEIRFDVLSVSEIAEALVEREELPSAQAEFLARIASGSYARARAMVGEDVQEVRTQMVAFLQNGLSKSRLKATQQIDNFLPRSGGGKFLDKKQAVEQRLTLMSLWLRDALALSTHADQEIINHDQRDLLQRFVARFGDPRRIIQALGAIDKAQELTRLQVQLRPVMMQLVVELEEALT